MDTPSTSSLASDLGAISYQDCLGLQRKLVSMRKAGAIGDTLLFLEHDPPVYTIGRKSDPKNFSTIKVVKTERGGDVTYHSPGQLVVYPIYDLAAGGRIDVRAFVKKVEGIVVTALGECGVKTHIGDVEPGIWITSTGKKVASVGMAIDSSVSYHGVAVNISPQPLEGFARINPCGLDPSVMGYADVHREDLVRALLRGFSSVFGEHIMLDRDTFMKTVAEKQETSGGLENGQISAIRS